MGRRQGLMCCVTACCGTVGQPQNENDFLFAPLHVWEVELGNKTSGALARPLPDWDTFSSFRAAFDAKYITKVVIQRG